MVTWCVGHLVTMSYPEVYDPKYKKWSLETLPFIPDQFLYEVIPAVKKQFDTVSRLLNRADIDTIYVCTDSGGRESISTGLWSRWPVQRERSAGVSVIDSQTEDEILRESVKRRIFPLMIIWPRRPICGLRKTI